MKLVLFLFFWLRIVQIVGRLIMAYHAADFDKLEEIFNSQTTFRILASKKKKIKSKIQKNSLS